MIYLQNRIHLTPIHHTILSFRTQPFSAKTFVFCISGQALDRLVTVSSMPYGTSTSALSTSSSSKGSYRFFRMGYLILRGGFTLRCLQRLSPFRLGYSYREPGGSTGTPEVSPSRSSRTKDSSSQISYAHAAPDRDRTVSRRSEPSSRTALMGEQPNPWDILQPQDAMSRHRGAKPLRRCELLGVISLLSPG